MAESKEELKSLLIKVKEESDKAGLKLNIQIIEKAREFQETLYLSFIDYDKAFDCVDHNKLWKVLKEMGILGQSYLSPEKPVFRSRSNS